MCLVCGCWSSFAWCRTMQETHVAAAVLQGRCQPHVQHAPTETAASWSCGLGNSTNLHYAACTAWVVVSRSQSTRSMAVSSSYVLSRQNRSDCDHDKRAARARHSAGVERGRVAARHQSHHHAQAQCGGKGRRVAGRQLEMRDGDSTPQHARRTRNGRAARRVVEPSEIKMHANKHKPKINGIAPATPQPQPQAIQRQKGKAVAQ